MKVASGATHVQAEHRDVSRREVAGVTLSAPETEDGQDKRTWGVSPWRGEAYLLHQGLVLDE